MNCIHALATRAQKEPTKVMNRGKPKIYNDGKKGLKTVFSDVLHTCIGNKKELGKNQQKLRIEDNQKFIMT